MDLKCDKCDGQNNSTKYCIKCKKAFCNSITTSQVIMKESNEAELVDICPNCGVKHIIHFNLTAKPTPE